MTLPTFRLAAPDGFRLSASSDFLRGFTPTSGLSESREDRLALGFLSDGAFAPTAVELEQRGAFVEGVVHAGANPAAQVARMLSLDVDASGWRALGEREPEVGRLQARHPGFLPVCFPSVPDEKLSRLHGIAHAALEGRLDAPRLRALSFDEAVADLERLDGVGPWTAQHIVLRGAALADALPTAEPRVLAGLAETYRLDAMPSPRAFAAVAERWRPYRMWVAILLVRLAMASPAPRRTGRPRRAAAAVPAHRG